jgi:hypothetical protein
VAQNEAADGIIAMVPIDAVQYENGSQIKMLARFFVTRYGEDSGLMIQSKNRRISRGKKG